MAKKITELTELAAQPATGDLIIIEDVSASTTKKITWNNFVADASITTAKIADGAVTPAKLTFSGALVKHTSVQSISGHTTINYGAEEYDTDSYHDNSTNSSRLTVPTTGYYRFTATNGWAVSTGAVARLLYFIVNGDTSMRLGYQSTAPFSTVNAQLTTSTTLYLTAGDYVQVRAWSSTALDSVTDNDDGNARFMVERLA